MVKIKQTMIGWLIVGCFIPLHLYLAFGYVIQWDENVRYAHIAWMFCDDVFYYLEVARNILTLGFSTFDGTTLTNGYHPLWMMMIILLGLLTDGFQDGFILSFRVLLIGLNIWTGYLLFILCRRLLGNALLRYALFIYGYYVLTKCSFTGMECAIAAPLLIQFVLLTLEKREPSWPLLGFMGGLAVLARVDLILLVLPYMFLVAIQKRSPYQQWLKNILWACAAFSILVVPYLASNYLIFESWLPLSGVAKQLKNTWYPSAQVLHSIFVPATYAHLTHRLFPFVCVLLGVAACLYRFRDFKFRDVPLGYLAFYPVIYLGMLMLLYARPVEGWYYFPVYISLIVVTHLVQTHFDIHEVLSKGFGVAALCGVLLFLGISIARTVFYMTPESYQWYSSSIALHDFSLKNPGKLAMGDRAGMAAFINDQPLFQLEGIMNDHTFIQHLKNEDDLMAVMKENKVKYYVAARDVFKEDGRYTAIEPVRADPDSRKMRGILFTEPVLKTHFVKDHTWLSIFQIDGQPLEREP
jgi:hypothetical protein